MSGDPVFTRLWRWPLVLRSDDDGVWLIAIPHVVTLFWHPSLLLPRVMRFLCWEFQP